MPNTIQSPCDSSAFRVGDIGEARKIFAPSSMRRERRQRLARQYRSLSVGQLIQHDAGGKHETGIEMPIERGNGQVRRPRLDDHILAKQVTLLAAEVIAYIDSCKRTEPFFAKRSIHLANRSFEIEVHDDSSPVIRCVLAHARS